MIGRGGFGVVYQGLNTATGELIAVKQLSDIAVSGSELQVMEHEIKLLQGLSHPNVVRYTRCVWLRRHHHHALCWRALL